MIRTSISPSSDRRRTLLRSALLRRGARIVRRRNGGIARSTATRALAERSGGFGSTERHFAGRPAARSGQRTREECTVVAALPGPSR